MHLLDSEFKIDLIRSVHKNVPVLLLASHAIYVLLGRILPSPLSMWGNLNLLLNLLQDAAINIISYGLQFCCSEAFSELSPHSVLIQHPPQDQQNPFTPLFPCAFWHAMHKRSMLGDLWPLKSCGRLVFLAVVACAI